jgi:hypothetical protein
MILKSTKDIVLFIEQYDIKDYEVIQDIVQKAIGKTFIPIHFSDGEVKAKEYYIRHLLLYEALTEEQKSQKIWIDSELPFKVKDIFSTN